ncbi:dienelactone hydrolase family protein [Paenibacillus arenosi]|uniref:Dienelactone hydrolase family protein n=1 Tax=Paenibacillus arenosi TaxID=2774142 RepID=A0ABR9AW37_9BACL|nr:dienelactone hydrolase family protein [Paenibacillus arenosi]MBD8497166.1 dienelactone hydrolase family protein [Paenibacillus arenosi]
MFSIRQGSDTLVIVLHEIYGLNRHMEHVCKQWHDSGADVICLDILNREPFEADQEQEAYQYFMQHVGFERPVEEVLKVISSLRHEYSQICLVGYSVGATIAWRCSAKGNMNRVIAYYGSRIRDYVDSVPLCPSLLIYGQEEPSFDVATLVSQVQQHPTVQVYVSEGSHGFANPYAVTYNRRSAELAWEQTERFMNQGQIG